MCPSSPSVIFHYKTAPAFPQTRAWPLQWHIFAHDQLHLGPCPSRWLPHTTKVVHDKWQHCFPVWFLRFLTMPPAPRVKQLPLHGVLNSAWPVWRISQLWAPTVRHQSLPPISQGAQFQTHVFGSADAICLLGDDVFLSLCFIHSMSDISARGGDVFLGLSFFWVWKYTSNSCSSAH